MRHHTARRRWGALALAALLALSAAACGDDGDDGDTTAGGADGTTQTTAQGSAADGSQGQATTTAGDEGATTTDGAAVRVAELAFDPDSLRVTVGQAVTWTNDDETTHTVTADDGSFDSSLDPGSNVTRSFDEAGEITYHCEIHSSMTGTIVVTEG